jgi:hypothetical protein
MRPATTAARSSSIEAQGLKSASIRKKIGWLNSAVNLAIKEGRLMFNPFSSIVPKRDDEEKRLPLDDADVRNVKRNFGRLDKRSNCYSGCSPPRECD